MKIKFQNFLFLLGIALIGQLLFLLLAMVLYIFHGIIPLNDKIIDFIFNSFPYVAITIGIINFFITNIALYIYDKSKTYLPRLQWYSMFFGWTVVANKFINNFNPIDASVASCIVAALCLPNKTKKQRLYSAFKFALLLLVLCLLENMED